MKRKEIVARRGRDCPCAPEDEGGGFPPIKIREGKKKENAPIFKKGEKRVLEELKEEGPSVDNPKPDVNPRQRERKKERLLRERESPL